MIDSESVMARHASSLHAHQVLGSYILVLLLTYSSKCIQRDIENIGQDLKLGLFLGSTRVRNVKEFWLFGRDQLNPFWLAHKNWAPTWWYSVKESLPHFSCLAALGRHFWARHDLAALHHLHTVWSKKHCRIPNNNGAGLKTWRAPVTSWASSNTKSSNLRIGALRAIVVQWMVFVAWQHKWRIQWE